MRRKLLLLNVALAFLALYAGWQWRQAWQAAKAREAATLHQRLKPGPPPPFTALPPTPPVVASGYADVVQKTLFDRSRNPTVVVELPPPPPRPPMPALPAFYGIMNLGDGPMAILSVGSGAQQAVHAGEPIGLFKLVSVNTEEIAFEWDGQTVRKKLNELAAASQAPQPVAAGARAADVVAAPAPVPAAPQKTGGPGSDTGGGFKACVPDDPTPAGTIVDGMRKVVFASPFGPSCRWEPASH